MPCPFLSWALLRGPAASIPPPQFSEWQRPNLPHASDHPTSCWSRAHKVIPVQLHLSPTRSPAPLLGILQGARPRRGHLQALPPPKHHWDRASYCLNEKAAHLRLQRSWLKDPSFPGPQPAQTSKMVRVVISLTPRSALEKQYLLSAEHSFVILEADAIVNEPPVKEILNKYELAPAQVVPTSWHNICSFIATCELRYLICSAWAFGLVYAVQKAPKEIGDLGSDRFNNRSGFMTAIEKKSKVKHWKYDFVFLRRESGWGDVPD
ncbi:hypothetical protein Cgig2_011356 [Carnegiea gigantea]|uniref:Uncharacterized protein n=1 Tax=Carnegiea gigantea TaxID=171969 RepID=A0A9Q1KTE1_9CARY|nr:hypothetical protein Cgig2_011356 [Carnegiea gigantea]